MKPSLPWLLVLITALELISGSVMLTPASAQETVSVTGRVVNGTGGATVAPGLPVLLHSFGQSAGSLTSTETTTDESGGFRFDNVTVLPEGGYAVTTDYAGMRYSAFLNPDNLATPVELMIYETTQDISVVQVGRQALVITNINEKDQEITAVEFLTLSNRSDRTLLPDLSNTRPGQFSFLRFSLPPKAKGLDVQSDLVGGETIPIGAGFAFTAPVPPGQHSINFSFSFPYDGHAVSYRQSLLQGAQVYQVLVPERLSGIQVPSLESMPPIDVNGSTYQVWEGQDFDPGQGLMVELANLPQPSLPVRLGKAVSSGTFWQTAIPATLGAALAAVLLYAGFKSPRMAAVPTGVSPASTSGDPARREAVVRALATLDERFQQGQVPEAEYRSRREQLKSRVLEPFSASEDSLTLPEGR